MKYISVKWKHQLSDEPRLLLSELNDERFETKKIEIFDNGRVGIASKSHSTNRTKLGSIPIPPLEEINLQEEFQAKEITKEEFEDTWNRINT